MNYIDTHKSVTKHDFNEIYKSENFNKLEEDHVCYSVGDWVYSFCELYVANIKKSNTMLHLSEYGVRDIPRFLKYVKRHRPGILVCGMHAKRKTRYNIYDYKTLHQCLLKNKAGLCIKDLSAEYDGIIGDVNRLLTEKRIHLFHCGIVIHSSYVAI